jgi:glycosyltransferase involved in cell wall biosynthesis
MLRRVADAPELTVVIPSRDRPELLRDCLAGLRAQPRRLQVLVVDDGSRVSLADVASAGGAVFLRQPPLGLGAARNRGLESARSEIVAFLDDDVLVSPGWSAAILEAIEAGADGVGGRVELAPASPPPRWVTPALRGYLSEYELGTTARWLVPEDPVPVGANCAVRRNRCLELGAFRTDLDRNGNLLSNGDTELFRRFRAAGARLRYAPGAVVRHRIGPERLTVEYFRARAFAQGRSDARIHDGGGAVRRWARPARTPLLLAQSLRRGQGPVPALLFLEYCRGSLSA